MMIHTFMMMVYTCVMMMHTCDLHLCDDDSHLCDDGPHVLAAMGCCSETGAESKWDDVIYPGMKAAVINTMIATQERSETRKVRSSQLYALPTSFKHNFYNNILAVFFHPFALQSRDHVLNCPFFCWGVSGWVLQLVITSYGQCNAWTILYSLVTLSSMLNCSLSKNCCL